MCGYVCVGLCADGYKGRPEADAGNNFNCHKYAFPLLCWAPPADGHGPAPEQRGRELPVGNVKIPFYIISLRRNLVGL